MRLECSVPVLVAFLMGGQAGAAGPESPAPETLFVDVRVFDGRGKTLSAPTSVLVRGNSIAAVGAGAAGAHPGATIIQGRGRTLMPGLIDAHTHLVFETISQVTALTADIGFVHVAAGKAAEEKLMRGFTSVRDVGGPVFGLKRAIDTGIIAGYVTVHAYTPRAVRQAIEAGVKCIDHGQLLDEPTAKLMAEKGIWWSLQPFTDDRPSAYAEGSPNRKKQLQMFEGTDTAYKLARKYKVKTAWGTDILFSAENAVRQGAMLTKMVRWYTPAEALKMDTADNAQLLALSGERSPYPGKLGVVEAGALADLLLVDGDPLENIKLLEDPARTLLVVMKDGRIYRNALSP